MDPENVENFSGCDHSTFPPQLFHHEDLIRSFESATTLSQADLINSINYLHFTGRPLYILLQHPTYGEKVLVKAHPEPCTGSPLTCRWDESYFQYKLESYQPLHLVLIDSQSLVILPASIRSGIGKSISVIFPEKAYVVNQRQVRRYACRDVSAEVMQSGFVSKGELINFSPTAFCVQLNSEEFKNNSWFNPDAPTSVRLFSEERMIYAELCQCIRCQKSQSYWEIVFAASSSQISRYPAKKIRNPRKSITPPLTALFEHPLFKKRTQRDIIDLSTTGFSISDPSDDNVLMPGMIIPNLSVQLAGISIAQCVVQVIYRRAEDQNIRYGIAILDMDIHSYSRINHILGINTDPHVSVSTLVDTDALWEFFFQTGFIYPKKYNTFHMHREDFVKTYRKLYQENPGIARHITYEQNGKIYGHMSMVRAYEKAWLIQHHAARPMENRLPGFSVLKHMMLFLHGLYTLPSADLDYVMCYFRPDNKFPERVFGGFARDLKNPQQCSLDQFSYLTFSAKGDPLPHPDGWLLNKTSSNQLWELDNYYRHISGGLFLQALQAPLRAGQEPLTQVANRQGFLRKWSLHSLSYESHLVCVMLVNQSDFGINLSEILNSIKVFVIDDRFLSWEVLCQAISQLAVFYGFDKIPLLIYPSTFCESKGVTTEKYYRMWVVDMRYSNLFMEYVQRKFRMKYE
jgi:hypothetical protein